NGKMVALTDNMLIPHKIKIAEQLKIGENELLVYIKPAVEEAKKYDYGTLAVASKTQYESLYIRKAPHMYGWDIMPRFVSAGIWRDVYIDFEPIEHINEIFLVTMKIQSDNADIALYYHVNTDEQANYELKIEGICKNQKFETSCKLFFDVGRHYFNIQNPEFWWPRGSGEANLYDINVSLLKNNTVIDNKNLKFGIRTIGLKRTSITDKNGSGKFEFIINGIRVFIKGSNWVPVDAFHSRDKDRIPAIMDMAADLNCNMLRCWGGNVYEDDLFYDLCDKLGIMVWQDFSMACAVYPQDKEFQKRIEDEAIAVVKRLRNHPCIALWSGDNECDSAYQWNYNSRINPNNNQLTRKVLDSVLYKYDRTRAFLPSSPYLDPEGFQAGEANIPENHLWGPRNYYKSDFYINSNCHFASEIGYHGCPSPESIKKFISTEKVWHYDNNEEWLLHSTSPVPEAHLYDYRIKLMETQVICLFGQPADNLNDYSFQSQVIQAEAFKFFIEMFRMQKWRRTGILWWNLMDGWPQFSDAVVDYYFNKKLAYYFIKQSQQQLCLMLSEPNEKYQDIIAVNDTQKYLNINYKIFSLEQKEVLLKGRVVISASKSVSIGKIEPQKEQDFLILEWWGDATGKNHYLLGKPPFDYKKYYSWLKESELYPVINNI
ncbi:MAG: Beta-galactosidase/beta-glucuronidase, partial [Clostridia bacterium]|nr:Beta-galactosidase/beta-glucuronidase [Clostridia bacterium]